VRLALVFTLAVTLPALASAHDQPSTQDGASKPAPDFLFGQPRGSAGIRGSWLFARADSDWYRFVTGPDQLTIERRDFNAPVIGGNVGFSIAPRVDAGFRRAAALRAAGPPCRGRFDDQGPAGCGGAADSSNFNTSTRPSD